MDSEITWKFQLIFIKKKGNPGATLLLFTGNSRFYCGALEYKLRKNVLKKNR